METGKGDRPVQLEHRFTVPATPEKVWAALTDPQRVAPCMPGATLTSVEGNRFAGSVKVRLGPISLLYNGSGEFVETDEAARRVVIKASGKDSRGNGTASATVTVQLTAEGGSTSATTSTDLAITGKPAQFGRGMITEVGGKILDTFASCLAGELAPVAAADPAAGSAAAGSAAAAEPDAGVNGTEATEPPALTVVDGQAPATKPIEPATKPIEPVAEPIDLLDYAGPSVAKRVIPVVLALIVAFIVIRRLRR
jgi:uncharacterized protein